MKTAAKVKGAGTAGAAARIDAMLDGMERLADAQEAGGPLPPGTAVRTYDIPDPTAYTPERVAAVRGRLGISQSAFAKLVGVSTVLAQSWEQGKRVPSRLASRMLDTLAADPAAWLALANAKLPTARASAANAGAKRRRSPSRG